MKRRDRPPLKTAGVVFLVLIMAVLTLVYLQFRGDLSPSTTLTMVSDRGGLVMDTGSKVTFNGVVIGRVLNVSSGERDGKNIARVTLDVDPHYLPSFPPTCTPTSRPRRCSATSTSRCRRRRTRCPRV